MNKKQLIFDFDGTIVESGPLVYNNLAHYSKNTKMTWNELRNLPSNEVVSALGITKLDLPKLILKIREDFKLKISDQPIVPGIKEALVELKEKGFSLHIVSSNSKENIEKFLSLHNLGHVISSVESFFTIFGKAQGISKLLKKIKCPPAEAIYIGDETRDIQAAEKANTQSLSVTWGYNSENPLQEYKPDMMARTPKDLVTELCRDIG